MSFVARSINKPEDHPLYSFVQQAQSTNPKAHHNIFHRFFQHDLARQFEDVTVQLPVDPTTPLRRPPNFITINQNDKELAITNTKCLRSLQEHLIVYLDSSRIPDHRSAATAWCENTDTYLSAQLGQARLFGNYNAKYRGLHLGLNLILRHATGATRRASLVMDNQGVVTDMTSRKKPITSLLDRRKAYDILRYIQQAYPSLRVLICWCPGHKGVAGNEKVDKLANKLAHDRLPKNFETNINPLAFLTAIQDWKRRQQNTLVMTQCPRSTSRP